MSSLTPKQIIMNRLRAARARVRTEWPRFGSPEVAAYGAVGLEELPAAPPAAPPQAFSHQKSEDGTRDRYEVDPNEPLPLLDDMAHHAVDDWHLWLGVGDGKVLVADATDHALLTLLLEGKTPNEAATAVAAEAGNDRDASWEHTAALIARLAAAGIIEGIQGYHSVKKIRPQKFARFHLTQRCQLECIHCYTSSSPHLPSDDELPLETWLRLVDEFVDNGGEKILFTGGEALVYPGCMDVMRRAHERGLEVTLFSNGILVPRHIEALKEVADVVQISLDGPGEESHDAVRGRGSFDKAMRAIHMLLDAGVETRISTTIMVNNWEAIQRDFPKLIEQFEGTALSFRVSYGAMAHGRGTDLDHSLNYGDVRQFVDDLLSRVNTTENRDKGRNALQKITGCGYAEQLVIAPDGLVYPCHLLSGALGHVDQMPVKDITNYLKRTSQAFSVENREGCGTCDLRNLCGGTCRVEDEKFTGSRLVTTCTPQAKLQKKRFLVRRYRPANG